MRILGIDTSTKTGGIALIQGSSTSVNGVVLEVAPLAAEYAHGVSQEHSGGSWLISAIDRILQDGKTTPAPPWKGGELETTPAPPWKGGELVEDIDGIAVVIGPGSFTGLRIGVATAKGLGYSLGIQIAEVTSLDALAANIPNGFVCPIMNAMREEVYTAFYENENRKSEYMLIKPEDLARKIAGVRDQGSGVRGQGSGKLDNQQPVIFLGDGVKLWEDFFTERLAGMVSFAPFHDSYIRATTVASIGMKMLLEGKGKQPEEIVPFYLRVSNAEQQRK